MSETAASSSLFVNMKRVDEARVIKIAESPSAGGPAAGAQNAPPAAGTPAAPAAAAAISVSVSPASTVAAATPLFPARILPSGEMAPQQPLTSGAAGSAPATSGGAQQQPPAAAIAVVTTQPPVAGSNYTRVITHNAAAPSNSVTVYRDGVNISQVQTVGGAAANATPPAAHSSTSSLPPSTLHLSVGNIPPQQPVVTQPPSNLAPEPPIALPALPTTPVSVQQYPVSFQPALKTLSNAAVSSSAVLSSQSIVQSLQQQQNQQPLMPKQVFGPPGIRPALAASLPQVPNPAVTPAVVTPAATSQPPLAPAGVGVGGQAANFQRLKVEDALSYLDQVINYIAPIGFPFFCI